MRYNKYILLIACVYVMTLFGCSTKVIEIPAPQLHFPIPPVHTLKALQDMNDPETDTWIYELSRLKEMMHHSK